MRRTATTAMAMMTITAAMAYTRTDDFVFVMKAPHFGQVVIQSGVEALQEGHRFMDILKEN
jgi:outer membrane protein assembly factor BamE (lipoprotein component of BamABCDE complex)